jgi:hypothetical protein
MASSLLLFGDKLNCDSTAAVSRICGIAFGDNKLQSQSNQTTQQRLKVRNLFSVGMNGLMPARTT